MGLSHVFDLFDKGKFDECIIAVEELQGEEKLQGQFIKIFALLEGKGDIKQAKALTDQLMKTSLENIKWQIISLGARSLVLWWQARQKEAIRDIEKAEQLLGQMNEEERKKFQFNELLIKLCQATFYHGIGKLDKALKILNKGITMAENKPLPWKSLVLLYHSGIGNIHEEKGEFDVALDSFLTCLAESEESFHVQSFVLNYISNIYHILGRLELSLEYAQRALGISRRIGLKRANFRSLLNLGSINQSKGELQLAVDYFQKCLTLSKEIGYEHFNALSYYKLIGVLLLLNSQKQANNFVSQLQKMAKESQHYDIKILAKLAEALVLKQSNRFQDKGLAQDIFRQIINEKNASQDYRSLAVLNLCDLLLLELKIFGEEEIFGEILQLSQYLSDLAKEWDSSSLKIEALILQAKFALIEGTAENASKLLETAHTIAKEKELEQLAQKTKKEQETLKDQLNKWAELVEKNAPLVEKLEYAQIKEYIDEAIKLKEITKDSFLR